MLNLISRISEQPLVLRKYLLALFLVSFLEVSKGSEMHFSSGLLHFGIFQ